MKRWLLSLFLLGSALLCALSAPSLNRAGHAQEPDEPSPPPFRSVRTQLSSMGSLTVSPALDQSAQLLGSGEERHLVVTLDAPPHAERRQPVSMAVVMDRSGSMADEHKIQNARLAAQELLLQLGPQDRVSLVAFSSGARVVLPLQPVRSRASLSAAVRGVTPGGGTNLQRGLEAGLEQLRALDDGGYSQRRLVVLSDGLANEGITNRDSLAAMAGSQTERGVTVSALGLGVSFDDYLLSALADAGGGRYDYVSRATDLSALFSQELEKARSVVGKGVSLEVSLAPGVEVLEVYGYQAYDGARTSDGYRAFVGDVHAGERRKVVARLRVPDQQLGAQDVAQVRVRYQDLASGSQALHSFSVQALVSDDPGLVQASVQADAARLVGKALAGMALERGTQLWRQGDVSASSAALASGQATLDELSTRYALPELSTDSAQLRARQQRFATTRLGTREADELGLEESLRALGYLE